MKILKLHLKLQKGMQQTNLKQDLRDLMFQNSNFNGEMVLLLISELKEDLIKKRQGYDLELTLETVLSLDVKNDHLMLEGLIALLQTQVQISQKNNTFQEQYFGIELNV